MSPGIGLPAAASSFTSLRGTPHRPDLPPPKKSARRRESRWCCRGDRVAGAAK